MMFDSLQDQILEKEMLKILKQLQGNYDDPSSQNTNDLGEEVKVSFDDKDQQTNARLANNEVVEKVNIAVGDDMIDWEDNYINLMKECGLELPGQEQENNDIEDDDQSDAKFKLKVKKNEEHINREFAQYKADIDAEKEIQQDEEEDEEEDEDEEKKKHKQMMDDLHNEEEQIMTVEQQKELFKQLRSKYLNNSHKEETKEIKSVDTTAYATNESEVNSTASSSAAPLDSLKANISDNHKILKETSSSIKSDSVKQEEQAKHQDKDDQVVEIPRSLLPKDHQPLTREMYDEWKKQQKALKKAAKNAKELGITYQGEYNLENIEDSSDEENQDEKDQQKKGEEDVEQQEDDDNEVIDEEDEDLYDENQTADEVLTELKKEYISTNKWNCKEYKITYSNNDVYEGEVDDHTSLKDGWGLYLYANGEKYEGFFQDDIIQGYGRYWFLGGHKYEGDWKQGMKHGIGNIEFASGDKYIGYFENDNFHGSGEYYYKNGDKFEGTFVQGKKNGPGKFLGINGRKIIGEWIDDQLQHF